MKIVNKIVTDKGYSTELDRLVGKEIYIKVTLGERLTYGEYSGEPSNGFAVEEYPGGIDLSNYDVYTANEIQRGETSDETKY